MKPHRISVYWKQPSMRTNGKTSLRINMIYLNVSCWNCNFNHSKVKGEKRSSLFSILLLRKKKKSKFLHVLEQRPAGHGYFGLTSHWSCHSLVLPFSCWTQQNHFLHRSHIDVIPVLGTSPPLHLECSVLNINTLSGASTNLLNAMKNVAISSLFYFCIVLVIPIVISFFWAFLYLDHS